MYLAKERIWSRRKAELDQYRAANANGGGNGKR